MESISDKKSGIEAEKKDEKKPLKMGEIMDTIVTDSREFPLLFPFLLSCTAQLT